MDFHSLPRKDLQFFCKKNQIPANMTNIAMADALKALEIVEGIEEYANQSPTSVAKNLPSAARTAARRKTVKGQETQPSELVTRSCYVTSKSLAGEMNQENTNTLNVIPQSRSRRAAATTVAMNLEEEASDMKPETKTPAARTTRRSQAAAASCKKDESVSVQRAYSTRRSVKLLEESMAGLCLKTTAKKKIEDSSSDSKLEKTEEDAEEVVSVRDLNASMEKEWKSGSKNDPDLDVLYGDLGDITFSDANMNGIESNTDSFVLVEQEQETLKVDDFVVVDHAASSTTTNLVACNKEAESEQIKNDSEAESNAETKYETDGDVSGVVVDDSNQEALGSKVDSVTTVLVADEPKEIESEESKKPEEEAEMIDSEPEEAALVSGKKKTQEDSVTTVLVADEPKEIESEESKKPEEEDEMIDSKPEEAALVSEKKKTQEEDSDEWSDPDFEIDSESEEALVSDKKNTPSSSSRLAGKETKTPLSPSQKVALVAENNGEGKSEEVEDNKEEKKKKKKSDEERLKEVSMRQLTKMVKELAIKSKQRPQHKYLD